MRSAVLQIGLYLSHTVVQREYFLIQFLQIGNLLFYAHIFPGSSHGIAAPGYGFLRQPHRFACPARRCNTGSSTGGTQHFFQGNAFYIGIATLVSGKHTHSHTEIDIGAAVIHLTVH